MATDILTALQTRVRASLADTGTIFPDAMIDAAIFECVSDISRVAPRESVHIVVLHNRTVTDESFTSNHDTWVDLSTKPIDMQQSVVVTTDPAATTYVEDTDYIIDYAQGRIQVLSTGGMANSTGFLIDYEKTLRAVDMSTITDFISIDRVEVSQQNGYNYHEYVGYYKWGDILWLHPKAGTTDSNLTENDHVRVWYRAEHTKPGASAGSYPAYLDDVVVKGAVAYALLSKHRERNIQAVADLATARTQLALADDDQSAIDTIETLITTALDAASTAIGLVNALTDTPQADAEIALDAALSTIGTDAAKLFNDSALFDIGIQSALDMSHQALLTVDAITDTPLADAETALDKLITYIVTDAEALLDASTYTALQGLISAALDGAAAITDETASPIVTALGKVVEHLETDTTNPDSAENQLVAGDALINANNVGQDAALGFANYARAQIEISNTFVGEANSRANSARVQVEEAAQRVQQKMAHLSEVDRRIQMATSMVAEARERLGIANVVQTAAQGMNTEASQRIAHRNSWLATINMRLTSANTYVMEARGRMEIATSIRDAAAIYVNEAIGRMQQIDRHLALGNLYISQARTYQEGADRENASADRFLFDANARHADYWTHLNSRVEMSQPNQVKVAQRQNP